MTKKTNAVHGIASAPFPEGLPARLACPFCGSEDLSYLNLFACEVQCNNQSCLTEGPKRDTLEDAITAWNVRFRKKND